MAIGAMTSGTLIGADILNLEKVQGLGAPIASIGGAGTFDGVFMTGVLAALLASVVGSPSARVRRRQVRPALFQATQAPARY